MKEHKRLKAFKLTRWLSNLHADKFAEAERKAMDDKIARIERTAKIMRDPFYLQAERNLMASKRIGR